MQTTHAGRRKENEKMKISGAFGSENGAALLVAMMILTLIAIMAMSLSRTTTIELQIVRNDTEKRLQFYLAEAAAREAAQEVENMAPPLLSDISAISWINATELDLNALDLYAAGNLWIKSAVDETTAGTVEVGYTVVDETGPIDLSAASNMHQYAIVGMYDVPNGMKQGQVLVEIGYRRRF
jgi:hypothetical protein